MSDGITEARRGTYWGEVTVQCPVCQRLIKVGEQTAISHGLQAAMCRIAGCKTEVETSDGE